MNKVKLTKKIADLKIRIYGLLVKQREALEYFESSIDNPKDYAKHKIYAKYLVKNSAKIYALHIRLTRLEEDLNKDTKV